MSLRVLHVLDHSIPLHSGYTFRTLSILREQRKLGWDTCHLTSPKHIHCSVAEEDVDGWHFYRTLATPTSRAPGLGEIALMRQLERRLQQVAEQLKPSIIHAHSPVLNALPAIRVGRRLGIPVVYEVRAFWEDAAVDHGSTTEGSLRYRLTRWLETRALRQAQHTDGQACEAAASRSNRAMPSSCPVAMACSCSSCARSRSPFSARWRRASAIPRRQCAS